MSQTPYMPIRHGPERRDAAPAAERRPAIWPWVLMPLVALALFLALHTVRQGGVIGQWGARTNAASVASGR